MKYMLSLAGVFCVTGLRTGAVEIAHSQTEFSGTQGSLGWYAGWRNFTTDGLGDEGYDANASFIPFTPAQWNGTAFALGGNPPWSTLGAENAHPNGTNNSAEHWVIRRWVAEELTEVTPLRVTLHLRKTNPNGGGTTGVFLLNGLRKFSQAVEGNDAAGYSVTCYVNALPGDKLDFALTPVNFSGTRDDGSDGSAFSMVIDDDLGTGPHLQPDGTEFQPASGADTDADTIPDFWERSHSPTESLNSFSATGDYDGDGLTDKLEHSRGSNPTLTDTDADGLTDLAETKTGQFSGLNDTGSDPAKPDTDNDGLNDAAEVNAVPPSDPSVADTDGDTWNDFDERFYGSDATLDTDTPLSQAVADSVTEFSGVQGQEGWEYGYRNLAGGTVPANYDPDTVFIPFAGGADSGEGWTGGADSPQHWDGGKWDLQTGAPWTELTRDGSHPNGLNNGEEHWTIRRWRATELTAPAPVTVYWMLRKGAAAGDGVTGAVYLNGKILDTRTIGGASTVPSIWKLYLTLKPADILDLVHSPAGRQEGHDGSDGSGCWIRVDKRIAAAPVSSDGAWFVLPGAADTDGDGLADGWEIHATTDRSVDPPLPGALNILTAATDDTDGDGLTNLQEMERGTSPLQPDTDGDGLTDRAETATGVVAGPEDTGTSPLRPDTDDDGLTDAQEVLAVQLPSNPWLANSDADIYNDANELRRDADPAVTTEYVNGQPAGNVAHSVTDFSGVQGPLWYYGYRDLRADGGDPDSYDPEAHFLQIADFNGTAWAVGGEPPWTSVAAETAHPNGPNGQTATHVHWAVRRFHVDPAQFPAAQPLAFWWHLRKSYLSDGDGVSGGLYVNGQKVDEAAVRSRDVQGVTRIYYLMADPGDNVDLVLRHYGPDSSPFEGYDYSDGSHMTLRITGEIPEGAVQPDGTPFQTETVTPAGFSIAGLSRHTGTGAVTVSWPSETGKTYRLYYSTSMTAASWTELTPAAGLPGTGAVLSFTDSIIATSQPAPARVFYRVGVH